MNDNVGRTSVPHHNHDQSNLTLLVPNAPSRSPSISYLDAADMERHQQEPGAETTTSQVELSLSCQNLPDCDVVTKSDPQVIVYLMNLAGDTKLCEIGRTEIIQDNLNPKFAKKILMQYHFEQIQRLRFEVYDIDPIGENDYLGGTETTLADIVTARSSTFKQQLTAGPKRSKPAYLIIDVEELVSCKQIATFTLLAQDLPASFCGLASPSASVYVYRSNENGSLTIVHRSPSVRNNCNPRFPMFTQKLVALCNGDLDRTVRFELVDTRFGAERNMGYFETTINDLKSNQQKEQVQKFELLPTKSPYHNDTHSDRRDYKSTGSTVIMNDFRLITQASFLDYIKAGAQIHFVIAVDFTASNGDPQYPDSLHYLDPMGVKKNPYEQALSAVGTIIKPYDTQGLYAGFGFGAKLNSASRPPSHMFPLNGDDKHPYVRSMEELLQVYRQKVRSCILSGPTNFAPCIAHCANIASQFEDGNHYFVLLIVTDGIISDMRQTKKAIVDASQEPMSIIICGVGNADFACMDELDSDDVVMRVDGKAAQRDIVQFVPMNKFIPQMNGRHRPERKTNSLELQRLLAEEVLREIPDQLTGYMLQHGHHPELTFANDTK